MTPEVVLLAAGVAAWAISATGYTGLVEGSLSAEAWRNVFTTAEGAFHIPLDMCVWPGVLAGGIGMAGYSLKKSWDDIAGNVAPMKEALASKKNQPAAQPQP